MAEGLEADSLGTNVGGEALGGGGVAFLAAGLGGAVLFPNEKKEGSVTRWVKRSIQGQVQKHDSLEVVDAALVGVDAAASFFAASLRMALPAALDSACGLDLAFA